MDTEAMNGTIGRNECSSSLLAGTANVRSGVEDGL